MENVIVVIFEDEKSSYQVLSDLKNRSGSSTVLQAGIIQKQGGSIVTKDGWSDASEADTWASGGLIGGIVGILGGPFGVLFGASLGMLVGGTIDADDAMEQTSMIERAASELKDGYLALIAIADEDDAAELDKFFESYGAKSIIRHDVAAMQEELYMADEAAREMKKQARAKMREERRAEVKSKANETKEKVKSEFNELKSKL